MQVVKTAVIIAACAVLLGISWLLTMSSGSQDDRFKVLMEQADAYIADGVYVHAAPLLVDAATLGTEDAVSAQRKLKDAYKELRENRLYQETLEAILLSPEATYEDFIETSDYLFSSGKYQNALEVLKRGAEKLSDERLTLRYEETRYQHRVSYTYYEEMSAVHGNCMKVFAEGKWGLITADGRVVLPLEYDWVSTFDGGYAVVKKENEIYTVNSKNQRVALLKEKADELGNLSENRILVRLADGWVRATPAFALGTQRMEAAGMYSGGHLAYQTGGKWGVDTIGGEMFVPVQYEGIAMDELGKCYAKGRVFVKEGGAYYLYAADGKRDTPYEDARPFADGLAAVKKSGLWGFIDETGTEVLPCEWEDALSFGMHLAAVYTGDSWGYINEKGHLVIEPQFLEAKSFSGGVAPVKTDRGWTILTLDEYRKGAGLF